MINVEEENTNPEANKLKYIRKKRPDNWMSDLHKNYQEKKQGQCAICSSTDENNTGI